MQRISSFLLLIIILSSYSFQVVYSWSNGGFSTNPSNPNYGTHDWIAQHALDWLPNTSKQYIIDHLSTYLYGTELPDNGQAPDGIGDTTDHHVYYYANGTLQDDSAANRASTEYLNALDYLRQGDLVDAAKYAGIMTHYISDVAVFGHVMGSGTDWGAETHHSDYEDYVDARTSSYGGEFNSYLVFDGKLDKISAYNATIHLAYDTTFDINGGLTCKWMDQNYDWSNTLFKNRAGESLNLAVNSVADVLYTLYDQAQAVQSVTSHIVINEVEANPAGTDAGNEWVELYNPMATNVNIIGWSLSTTAGVTKTVSIPSGTTIQANGYYVVTYGSQWLDNSGESVILRNAGRTEVDRTPSLDDAKNDGNTWQRYPNGVDTDSVSDWEFKLGTRGVSNGGGVAPSPTYTLTIQSPDGSGSTSVTPGVYDYNQGVAVPITASPTTGYLFDHWILDGSNSGSTNPISITMSANHVLKAVFTVVPKPTTAYKLTIQTPDGSGGTIPSTGNYVYDHIVTVPVTANPLNGWLFDHWIFDGNSIGSANPYTVNMNMNHTLKAVFKQTPQIPTTHILKIDSPDGLGSTNPPVGSYVYGQTSIVSVGASSATGWVFDHWILDGYNVGNTNPYAVNMIMNHTLKAVFSMVQVKTYTLTTQVTGSGSTDPVSGVTTRDEGMSVVVRATAATGWRLNHWELDGVNVGNSSAFTVIMSANHQLNAVFEANPSVTPSGGVPGYPLETIIIGVIIGSLIMTRLYKRSKSARD
jgi:hypothetical protein